jgi:hypothetical protein
MPASTTYAAWAILLDKFGEGDDSALEALGAGSFVVDAGTVSRFYQRVEQVYKKRKQSWLYQFQRSFQLQNFKTEDDVAIALRNGRQNLSPLSRFVMLKGLPDDLRKTLQKDLEDFVAEIKQSLKDHVSKTSNGREKMLVLLNSFGLTTNTGTNNDNQNSNNNLPPTGRKIIF